MSENDIQISPPRNSREGWREGLRYFWRPENLGEMLVWSTEAWKRSKIPLANDRAWDKNETCNRSMQWAGGDNEANYHKRGNKEMPIDSVWYDFNSFGYRTADEFDLSGLAPGIMFAGCSHTVGAGVPYDAAWPTLVTKHFAQAWNIPELRNYNLAVSGASTDYVAMIVHQAVDVLKPKAVFVLWPNTYRMMWFNDRINHFVTHIANKSGIEEHTCFLKLFTEEHAFANFVRNYNFVANKLALANVPFVCMASQAIRKDVLVDYAPISALAGDWGKRLDVARDGFHRGIKSLAVVADMMIAKAEDLGLGQLD